jgi:hypothetical protein
VSTHHITHNLTGQAVSSREYVSATAAATTTIITGKLESEAVWPNCPRSNHTAKHTVECRHSTGASIGVRNDVAAFIDVSGHGSRVERH